MAKLDTVPEDFRDNLRTWRHVQGLSQRQAADILRCERSYLSQLENGRKPGKGVLIRFLREWELFKRRQDQALPPSLGGLDGRGIVYNGTSALSNGSALRRIPVISWRQAGDIAQFDQMPDEYEDSVPTDIRDEKAFAVRLRGDSMEPRIEDGDLAIVLPSVAPTNGEIVLANLRDQGACCKIMHVQHDKNLVTLTSYNPAFPPMQHSRDDFHWMFPIVQVIKNLRRS